ncbi:MAG: histidine kinase [Clostridium sp.]|nr:histidine kinase [Clostridium sp.]
MDELKKRLKEHQSLRSSFMFAFVVSFLIPSFILIIILFFCYARVTVASQEKEYRNTMKILSSHLVNHINANSGLSLTYLFDTEFSNMYYFLNRKDYTENYVDYTHYVQAYNKTLNTRMTLLGDSIIGVGFIPNNKNQDLLFYVKKYDNLQEINNYSYKDSDWYNQLQNNNQLVLYVPSETSTKEHTISMIRAVKDVDKRIVVGYEILDISLDFIFEPLKDISIGSYSGIFLESPQGELLFSTNDELIPDFNSMLSGENSRSRLIRGYDLYSYTDKNFRFTFYYLSSRYDLYNSLLYATGIVFLFYLAMIFMAAAIFRRTSNTIRNSVEPVLTTMEKYHAGDSHIQCDTSKCSISEIETIAINLNEMIQKINFHIDKEYKFQMEQKAAEYQALQAEINPHFLHNVLNLLIALNRLGDRTGLEQSIISLSKMFRYTCEHNFNSTIQQEFDFIRNYLFLQKTRFDERLEFQIYIEPGLEDFEIPKLLVQPLVENAIVHGLEPSDGSETIQLSAITASGFNGDTFIIINVINNGLPYIENKSYKRVGLKSIEERLAIFSPNSFFIIRGGVDKPSKCTIMIPQKKGESNVYTDCRR